MEETLKGIPGSAPGTLTNNHSSGLVLIEELLHKLAIHIVTTH